MGTMRASPTTVKTVYHVVTGATGATLDGFTITAGNADGAASRQLRRRDVQRIQQPDVDERHLQRQLGNLSGGGMYNTVHSNPMLTNVTFSGNRTLLYGGGMYNDSSSPTLTNVTFSGNIGDGGGMYNYVQQSDVDERHLQRQLGDTIGGGMYNCIRTAARRSATRSSGAIRPTLSADLQLRQQFSHA